MSGPRKKFGSEVMLLKVTRIDEHAVIRLRLTFKFLRWQKTRKSFVTCCIKLQLECWSGDIVPNPYPVFLSGSRNTPHATRVSLRGPDMFTEVLSGKHPVSKDLVFYHVSDDCIIMKLSVLMK